MSYEDESIDFTVYQMCARTTALYPAIGGIEIYPVLELCNESGELAGKVKKIYRDKGGKYETEDLDAIADELGDCLWALSMCATELGISLEHVAVRNLRKLKSRQDRGKLQGSGDNR